MGDMGLIFTPVLVRHLLDSLGLSGPITGISWTHIDTLNSPIGRYNSPPAAHPSHPPTFLYMQSVILK